MRRLFPESAPTVSGLLGHSAAEPGRHVDEIPAVVWDAAEVNAARGFAGRSKVIYELRYATRRFVRSFRFMIRAILLRSNRPRRGRLAAAVLLTALLLAADGLAWMQMQRLLDRRLDRLVQDAARSGWQLRAASDTRGGWPFSASRILTAPRLHGGDTLLPGGVTWSGERITAILSPLHPRRITILASGAQAVWAGTGPRILGHALRFRGTAMAIHLPVDGVESTGQASFGAAALQLALPDAGPDDVVAVAGMRGTIRWRTQALALTLALHDTGQPGRLEGHPATDAAVELSLIGPLGPAGGSAVQRLQAWRAGAGRLLVRQAVLGWKNARIDVSGQATLDGNLQPDGGFTITLIGADALLDGLAHSGRLTPATASAARAVLGLISAAGNDAGTMPRGQLQLPLALHAGILSLGQIPLLRVPSPMGALP